MSGSGGGGHKPSNTVNVTVTTSEKKMGFTPFEIPKIGKTGSEAPTRLTMTTTIRGEACDDFEDLLEKTGLNKSQLLTQMVYHCLGRTSELQEFYKRVAILGK